MLSKQQKRNRRHRRVRAKIFGTGQRPRLYVFRSNKHLYAQLINDEKAQIIAVASDFEIKEAKIGAPQKSGGVTRKVAVAFKVGELVSQKALKKGIKKVVFDRGGYKYHGRIKAVAEGVREGGLKF